MVFEANSGIGIGAAPKPGAFGRFYLQELINSGGMADIWVATDQPGKPYALRKLHDRLRFNFLAKRRFLRGCEILSKIHHNEYVIHYYEHGKINGSLYCLMEYVEGSNLKELFGRGDPILREHVANILIDSALAVEHVHDSGFMHLDLKPENCSKKPGTPAYMAPEQLRRQPFDHRVDIFAYGVTAYELLTGQKPFAADTPAEILRKQMNRSDFTPPRQFNPDIPPALEKTILKALEHDPDKRHPIMSVLVHELKTALYV